MKNLHEIVETLNLKVKTADTDLNREVTGGYASDLLSDVMANSKAGNVWVTLQMHTNIVAVAGLKELAAIILVNNRTPADSTLAKANEENIPVLVSESPAFEVIGKLYELGIR